MLPERRLLPSLSEQKDVYSPLPAERQGGSTDSGSGWPKSNPILPHSNYRTLVSSLSHAVLQFPLLKNVD